MREMTDLCNNLPDQDPAGKPGCDFMGVNHYARGVVGFFLNPTNKGPKGIADMGCEPPPPPPPLRPDATPAILFAAHALL